MRKLPTTGPWPTAGISRCCRALPAVLSLLTAVPAAGASALVGGSSAAGGITQIAAQVPAEIPAVASPSFFAVSVSDLDAAESWYRRILGLETVRAVQSRDDRSRAVVMRRGDLVVELVHFDGSRSPRTDPGVEHPFQIEGLVKAGVFVADAAQWHAYLQGAHVDTDADVVTDETLAVRTFVFRDLEGNRIQVFEGCEQGC